MALAVQSAALPCCGRPQDCPHESIGWDLDGEVIHTCPYTLVTDTARHMLDLHRWYARGVLLVAGGIYDQPARYIQAMELIDTHASDHAHRDPRRRPQ